MTRASAIAVLSMLAHSAAAAPCIPPASNPVMMAIGGGKLSYCFEIDDDKLSCFATELTSGKTAPAASPPPLGRAWSRLVPTAPAVKLKNTDGGKRPRLCRPDGTKCKTLVMTHAIDQGMGLVDAENAALTIAALSTLQWIDTFDLRTGKRLASFTTGLKDSSCNTLDFAGDTLVIGEQLECGQSARTAWLATKTGKKIANVGGDTPLVLGSMARVTGNTYAFATLAGEAVIYQDVTTGTVSKRIAVGAAVADSAGYLLGDGSALALVYGGARAGDLAIIDAASGKVASYPGKRCPK